MPYNPSSAYPRHTTYTPPVFNRGGPGAINAPNWWPSGGGATRWTIGQAQDMSRQNTANAIATMSGLGQRGVFSSILRPVTHTVTDIARRAAGAEIAEKFDVRGGRVVRADEGGPPGVVVGPSTPQPVGPLQPGQIMGEDDPFGPQAVRTNPNERAPAIEARAASVGAVEGAVDRILSSKIAGTVAARVLPNWTTGRKR